MILIVGCGFLGQYILQEIQQQTDEPIIATYRNNKNNLIVNTDKIKWLHFDSTKEEDIAALKDACGEQTLTVFYLASCHNIDFVYNNPDVAYKANVTAVMQFLKSFKNINRFIYSSTDCVYGEGKDRSCSFKETDRTNPLNLYGRQKREAEQHVLQNGYYVVRLPYMLGPSLSEKKSFYDVVCDDLKNSTPVYMADGFERSVLSYRQVASILVALLHHKDIPNILNIAGDNSYTKLEMARCIAKKCGFENELVVKMSKEATEKLFMDVRAESTIMCNRLLKSVLGIDRLEWECSG